MHMADALVSPAVGGAMWICGSAALAYSVRKINKNFEEKNIPLMGVLGAFVFAAQMLNFTIPGTGSSGHICGGLLLSALLGPTAGFVTLGMVLLIQALFFADGGILAYGANLVNMGLYTCLLVYPLLFKPLMKRWGSRALIPASVLTCVLGLQLGAFSVVLETMFSGVTALPFTTFLTLMQPIHLLIGGVEGVATGVVLKFVWEARPTLLQDVVLGQNRVSEKFSFGKIVATFMIMALLLGGGLSLFASEHPDGLEWSIEKITGSTEVESDGALQELVGRIQEVTALMPDYDFAKETGSGLGTSVAGIGGGIFTCLAVGLLGKLLVTRNEHKAVKS